MMFESLPLSTLKQFHQSLGEIITLREAQAFEARQKESLENKIHRTIFLLTFENNVTADDILRESDTNRAKISYLINGIIRLDVTNEKVDGENVLTFVWEGEEVSKSQVEQAFKNLRVEIGEPEELNNLPKIPAKNTNRRSLVSGFLTTSRVPMETIKQTGNSHFEVTKEAFDKAVKFWKSPSSAGFASYTIKKVCVYSNSILVKTRHYGDFVITGIENLVSVSNKDNATIYKHWDPKIGTLMVMDMKEFDANNFKFRYPGIRFYENEIISDSQILAEQAYKNGEPVKVVIHFSTIGRNKFVDVFLARNLKELKADTKNYCLFLNYIDMESI